MARHVSICRKTVIEVKVSYYDYIYYTTKQRVAIELNSVVRYLFNPFDPGKFSDVGAQGVPVIMGFVIALFTSGPSAIENCFHAVRESSRLFRFDLDICCWPLFSFYQHLE